MEVPELVSMEDYDPQKLWSVLYKFSDPTDLSLYIEARLRASVSWIITKAYGNNIPLDLTEPFDEDIEGELCMKPTVCNALTTAELYCHTCTKLFPLTGDQQYQSHWDVIQALSKRGIYVMDVNESAVTEKALLESAPMKLSSHLSMIESLMFAFAKETVTVEKIVQAVRRFAKFNASSELPYDTEDALLFWINKVCSVVRNIIEKDYLVDEDESHADVEKYLVMEDLLKDINDGLCLAALISFYCPEDLRLEDVCLKPNIGIADSLFNLELVEHFCHHCLPERCLHLDINDLFYTAVDLKQNVITFLAELFQFFEILKPDCVTGGTADALEGNSEIDENVRPTTAKSVAPVPISSVTKKSFQLSQGFSSSTPDLNSPTKAPQQRQPLLPKRLQQHRLSAQQEEYPRNKVRRSQSFCLTDDKVQDSVSAWEEVREGDAETISDEPQRSKRLAGNTVPGASSSQLTHVTGSDVSGLLSNVSMDSEASVDFTDSSVDISDFEGTPRQIGLGRMTKLMGSPVPQSVHLSKPITDPSHPDYLELQSVTSNRNSGLSDRTYVKGGTVPRPTEPLEPLMPAKMRPSKEKNSNHTKDMESGHIMESPSSPSKPQPGKPRTLNLRNISTNNVDKTKDRDSSSSDEEFLTPSVENAPLFDYETPGGAKGTAGMVTSSPNMKKKSHQPPQTSYTTPHPSNHASPQSGNNTQSNNRRAGSQVNNHSQPSNSLGKQPSNNHTVSQHGDHVQPANIKAKPFEAFFVNTEASGDLFSGRLDTDSFDRNKATAQSFTLHHQARTPEDAKRKGIPVIDDAIFAPPQPVITKMRQGPSDRSSSEGSDQELKKIRADHRDIERSHDKTKDSHRPDSLKVGKKINTKEEPTSSTSPKTSFAQLKKQKDNGPPLAQSFDQAPQKSSLKDSFQKSKGDTMKGAKKATFAALPNQTTWQESAQKSAKTKDNTDSNKGDVVQPLVSEMHSVRMGLEERRRQIVNDKLKKELQRDQLRQQVGNKVFLQMIKGKSEDSHSSQPSTSRTPERRGSGTLPKTQDSQRASPQPLEKLEDRLRERSQSPYGEEALQKNFSRESIQDKIDGVRQKWFPEQEETSTKDIRTRPKSYHAPEAQHKTPNSVMQHSADAIPVMQHPADSVPVMQHSTDSIPRMQHSTDSIPRMQQSAEGIPRMQQSAEGIPRMQQSAEGIPQNPVPKKKEYGTSLERLNNSLSDLADEINQLSLQKQGKSGASNTVKPGAKQQEDKFIWNPSESGPREGEPDSQETLPTSGLVERRSFGPGASIGNMVAFPQGPSQQAQAQIPGYNMQATQPQQMAPQQPYGQYPQGYGQPGFMGGVQTTMPQIPTGPWGNMQQYQGMPQQQQPYQPPPPPSMYQNMYPQPMQQNGFQWHSQPSVQPPFVPPPLSASQPTQYPYGSNYSPGSTQASYAQPMQSHLNSQNSPYRQEYNSPRTVQSSSMNGATSLPQTTEQSPTDSILSPKSPLPRYSNQSSYTDVSPGGVSDESMKKSMTDPTSPVPQKQTQSKQEQDMSSSAGEPHNEPTEGFFVSFDSGSPKKQKPKLKSRVRKDSVKSDSSGGSGKTEEHSKPMEGNAVEDEVDRAQVRQTPKTPEQVHAPPKVEAPPALGFVIEVEPKDVSEQMGAFEKKKQKIMEQRMKRLEDQEKKRMQVEMKKAQKRAEFQKKQEDQEKKKTEERAKRDAIYQQYIQKKADREAQEEMTKAGMEVPRRPNPKAKNRPKSQPMFAHDSDGSQVHSSQEDVRHVRGKSPAGNVMLYNQGVDGDGNISHGGRTHRRPPSPDKVKGDANSDCGSGAGEYAGPKLYKNLSGSAKSNKTIIHNAVSHCCLAGVVNNETKNKVLEELNNYDGKHFIILFRNGQQQYRALYNFIPEREELVKVIGNGPKLITSTMMDKFFKYYSGTKSFSEITTTKHISVTVDAVTIHNHLWQKKSAAAKKPQNLY